MRSPLFIIARLALYVGAGLIVTGIAATVLQQVETRPGVSTAGTPDSNEVPR